MKTSLVGHDSTVDDLETSLVGHDSTVDLAMHCKAVRNVRKFFITFLMFDVVVIAVYGHKTWEDVEVRGSTGIQQVLQSAVVVFFSCDVVLASFLLWMLRESRQSTPDVLWPQNYNLICMNWAFNICSLLALACQRFFHAYGDTSLTTIALVYVALRVLKLLPLGQLKQEVAHAMSRPEKDPDRYSPLLVTWGTERNAMAKKCMVVLALTSVVVIVIVLSVAGILDHLSSAETKPPHMPEVHSVSARSNNTTNLPDVQPLILSGRFESAANGASAGGDIGAGISAVLGPEAIPEGATIGAAIGALAGFFDPDW